MNAIYRLKEDGLLGTFCPRFKVNLTSSAVKGEPSWNVTFSRSLNSHVKSSTGFQETARPG